MCSLEIQRYLHRYKTANTQSYSLMTVCSNKALWITQGMVELGAVLHAEARSVASEGEQKVL